MGLLLELPFLAEKWEFLYYDYLLGFSLLSFSKTILRCMLNCYRICSALLRFKLDTFMN